MDASTESDRDDDSAEALFAAWAVRAEAGEPEPFEHVLAAHPDLAAALRDLHAEWVRYSPLLKRLVPGSIVVEGEEADITDLSDDAASTARIVELLRLDLTDSERYRFRGVLGRGGGGAVLRVWDSQLDRPLAMKVVLGVDEDAPTSPTPRIDGRTLARFVDEARIASQLTHPGIVPVHEVGTDRAGRVFFTMKLVKGDHLSAVFDKTRRGVDDWDQVRVLGVLLRVCEAMAYAHERGVIHRDLKPANIMVGPFGEAYVMDWGLARVMPRDGAKRTVRSSADASVVDSLRASARADDPTSPMATEARSILGTPIYMSPEQARGDIEDVGKTSDVYAMGAMLYELLAGCPPYVRPADRPRPREILDAVVAGPPRPIAAVAPSAPVELVAVCEKAMSRDASRRYATMRELAEDVRAFLDRRVVQAYETGTWAETRKWVLRNKILAASIAVIAALLAVQAEWSRRKNADLSERSAELEAANQALLDREVERDRALYRAALGGAEAARTAGDLRTAKHLLTTAPEHLRGWEFDHLALSLDQSIATFETDPYVAGIAWDSSGHRVAAAGKSLRMWDIKSGNETVLVQELDSPATCIDWSPTANVLAYGCRDDSVWTLDVASGACVRLFAKGWVEEVSIAKLEWSRTGSHLLVPAGVWDCEAKEWCYTSTSAMRNSCGWDPSRTRFAFLTDGSAGEESVTVGGVMQSRDFVTWQLPEGFYSGYAGISWNPTGSHIAVGGEGGVVLLFDAGSGALSGQVPVRQSREPTELIWNKDGSRIAVAEYELEVWDLELGEVVWGSDLRRRMIWTSVVEPDGESFASVSDDKAIDVWGWERGVPIDRLCLRGHTDAVVSVRWSPAGECLATASVDGTLRLWAGGIGVRTHLTFSDVLPSNYVSELRFDSDSCLTAVDVEGVQRTWDASLQLIGSHGSVGSVLPAQAARRLSADAVMDDVPPPMSFAVGPASRHLAIGRVDGTVDVWDIEDSKRLLSFAAHAGVVTAVAWSDDGRLLATGSDDVSVRLWDIPTGALVCEMPEDSGGTYSLAWHPHDERIASGSADGFVRLWDASTGECVLVLGVNDEIVSALAWSQCGTRLAAADGIGGVCVWESDLTHMRF